MVKMSKTTIITVIGFLIVACILPWIVPFNNYWMNILMSFCYYSILASALNLLLGYTGQVSQGHNAFMCIGAYAYSIFTVRYKMMPGNQFIGVLLGMIIPFIFGLFIGLACSKLSAVFLAMTTGAFAKALKAVIVAEKWLTNGANGLSGIPKLHLFGIDKRPVAEYNRLLYYLALASTFVIILFCWRLVNSRTGRAFQAIKTSEVAAAAMGINVTGYKFLVCGISAAFSGFAGVIYSWNMCYLSPDSFDRLGVKLMTMATTGGMATIPGPIIGAVIMGYIPEALRVFSSHLQGVYGFMMIIMFLFMPSGFLGTFFHIRAFVIKTYKKTFGKPIATGGGV